MEKKQGKTLSREEELKVLEALDEKIKNDSDYGFRLLQKAGIYDDKRELTTPYREQ